MPGFAWVCPCLSVPSSLSVHALQAVLPPPTLFAQVAHKCKTLSTADRIHNISEGSWNVSSWSRRDRVFMAKRDGAVFPTTPAHFAY
ncbi:hypothetical protein BDZ89DRAFT_335606 [Hymenopellis radicata]|nr:hypothetical protein BDZ89DRAFT_335606 [Hymenopellis radicata]